MRSESSGEARQFGRRRSSRCPIVPEAIPHRIAHSRPEGQATARAHPHASPARLTAGPGVLGQLIAPSRLMALGCATLFLGLVLLFPLVGHATWHAFRA